MKARRAAIYGMPFDQLGGGQLHQAILAEVLTSRFDVDLVHHVRELTREQVAADYDLNLDRVRLRYVEPFSHVWPYTTPESGRFADPFRAHRTLTEQYDVFVNTVMGPPIRSYARLGVLLVLFPAVAREDVWPWCEPEGSTPTLKKTVRNAFYRRRWRAVFASYDRCVANSDFTAEWTAKRWGLSAEVVYPPVRARFDVRPKEKVILSVGRFSRYGATRKRQLDMVQAFAGAHEALLPGWEYVCLGGLANDADDRSYFEEVREAACGHPVRLLENPPAQVVKQAYERAAIFWHAAGYGEDESVHPERTEHFGMSTVEAMAAGCVPVVIRKGGQPEIVQHTVSGYLWSSMEELTGHTAELVAAPGRLQSISDAARARARRFTNLEAFEASMLRLLE